VSPGLNLTVDLSRLRAGLEPALQSLAAPGQWRSADGRVLVAVQRSPSGVGTGGCAERARELGTAYLARRGEWPERAGDPAAVLIVDCDAASVLAGVDAAGLHQLYHELDGTTLRVATRLHALLANRPGPRPAIDAQSIYDYVYYHCIPSPRTLFQGLHKLQAGHHLRARTDGVELRRHFQVRFESGADAADTERLAGELREVLRRGVARSLAPEQAHGAFLSGGLDSSTVAGMLAERQRPAQAQTFSIGFDARGYDEIEYARIASHHFGTAPHEYYVTPEDVCSAIGEVATAFDEPFGNSSAIPVYFCARLAREHGVERMLAGDGGDELFAGNARYAKQMLFERYFDLPAALRTGLLEPLLLGSPLGRLPLARKGAAYLRQATIPLPDRLQSWNHLHRHPAGEVFHQDLLGRIDAEAPLRGWRAEYAVHPQASAVDRMLFLDWKFTLHDNDLVKVNTMCALAGVDVAYPMLDPELVDFSCRVPGELKLRDRQLRWFYKHALAGFLPRAIIDKPKHGFGLPFGVWMRSHAGLRRLSEDALAAIGERRLFEPRFLEEVLRMHRDDAAGYYGEFVWVLTVLELWLQAHTAH
jgi:asparagine synthase (glutamine-hydrolysing)